MVIGERNSGLEKHPRNTSYNHISKKEDHYLTIIAMIKDQTRKDTPVFTGASKRIYFIGVFLLPYKTMYFK